MTVLDKLETLAANLWWMWNPQAAALFRRVNPDLFRRSGNNPLITLQTPDPVLLEDTRFAEEVDEVYETFQTYLEASPRYEAAPRTSYFCMEYGLHESLPLYSGGLGVLAGDHCKAASDLGLPFTAVGLFLRDGYFKQTFDASGWQQAEHRRIEPAEQPMHLVTTDDGAPLTVTVMLGRQPLHLKAWRLDVGRIQLFLLDADLDANPEALRGLTYRLYQGDRRIRLQQEIILGVGGVRLLHALGIETDVYHLNEGHCAFLTFELLRERLQIGMSREDAEQWVREHCVFTTHTPVPAGHDRFAPDLFLEEMSGFRDESGLSEYDLQTYGRVHPDDTQEWFTMTVLGLKLSRQANGVSALNGGVARGQWRDLFPERHAHEVPIGHITNGVHLPTWAAPYARVFLNKHLGQDWLRHRDDPAVWQRLEAVSDADLWAYRTTLRRLLIEFIRERVPQQSLPQTVNLSPDVLTIGFARRFATYKRATLLFQDMERAARLFANAEHPLQLVYAGKAHPADEGGKRFIQQIYEMSRQAPFEGRLIFLEDYNMEIGRMLVSGCDVWLNNPRRPMEASGTSGQKIGLHGGLNVSILDGWWPEGYDGFNGWAIGSGAEYADLNQQDAHDAAALYDVLEGHVIPTFYGRDAAGLPHGWIARMRRAMQTLPPHFSAMRMVCDYLDQMYVSETALQHAA